MHITDGATYAPRRTDDPPGTTRTRSASENRRAGKVSLSTKLSGGEPLSASSPSRNPNRIPCLTQGLTLHWPSIFSADRILPRVRASRNSRKDERASGLCSTSPNAEKCSIDVFRDCMDIEFGPAGNFESGMGQSLYQQMKIIRGAHYTHLHSLRISTPVIK